MSKTAFLFASCFSLVAAASEPSHEVSAGHHEPEPFLEYDVDFALGFSDLETFSGTTNVLDLAPEGHVVAHPGTSMVPTYERNRVWTTSLLLSAEHAIGHVKVGVKVPVVMGGMNPLEEGGHARTVNPVLGNILVEASHHMVLSPRWTVLTALELALPTATGAEAPLPGYALGEEALDEAAISRGEVLRAAEFARGSLDSTLFEAGRVGFIPKVAVDFHVGGLHVVPQAKLEMLTDTIGRAHEPFIVELVAGVKASYEIAHLVEPYVSAWGNITLTNHVERNVDVAVVEPGLRFKLGRFQPVASVVVPLAGRLADDRALAVRVGLTGEL